MLFLSHAGSDAPSARALAKGLKEAGLEVWCDLEPKAIKAGLPYTEQLERKLQDSKGLLLLVGKRGVDRWVRAEVDVALARQVEEPSYRIVPLLMHGAKLQKLPPFIARLHALSLEGEVTGWGKQEFQALVEHFRSATSRLAVDPSVCPFPGLESFGGKDARFYFGRDREIREALNLLGRVEKEKGVYRRWLAVEGTSGSGKSSFVKAGLVPAIRGGWVDGTPRRWRVAQMRPGKEPVRQLARALVDAFRWRDEPGRLAQVEAALRQEMGLRDLVDQKMREGWGFLLVIDQLEEVFTLSEGNSGPHRHLEALLLRALEASSPFHLLTTIRSDFLGHMGELPRLTQVLNTRWNSRYVLLPMGTEGLREALLAPAQMAGLTWDHGLPERLLEDAKAAGEELPLPLVAHVLRELWTRRSGQVMTRVAYDELGEVGGALTHSANALLATFSEEEQALVRKLMLALVKVGRGARNVRRTLTHEEAVRVAGGGKRGRGILVRLSGGRAPHEPAGSPAPPRLLSVGPKRVDLVHEALLERWRTLRSWLEESRSDLERQDDLEAAARLWKATDALPNETQLQYLKSAEPVSALSQDFLEAIKRAALARELVTRAQLHPANVEPQLSLRLILEAYQIDPGEHPSKALLVWFQQRQRLLLRERAGLVKTASFSPDGRHVLTASTDGTAQLWDAESGTPLAELHGHSDSVLAASFSPDGRRVLTASDDHTARLWDAESGTPLAELHGHSDSVLAASFSPDGRRVLTASDDHTARLWDADSGKPLAELHGHSGSVLATSFSPDGRRVLTASDDHTARLWDADSGKPLARLRGHSRRVTAASFSPDGRRVLTASDDHTARLWDADSGKPLARLLGHPSPVTAASFSPDGRLILSASQDDAARLWDADSGELLAQLHGHSGPITVASFSSDGRRILSASDDHTARLWDADSGQPLAEFRGHSDSVYTASFSPNGRRALTASHDSTTRLWDADSGQPLAEFRGHSAWVTFASFNPDGQRALTASDDHTARLWDANSGQPLAEFRGHSGPVLSASISPDGRHVLTASDDHTARLWDANSGQPLAEFRGHSALIYAASISPDGRRILTASADNTARLWDANSGQPLAEFRGHSALIYAASISPNGWRVLTASDDNTPRLWDADSDQSLVEFRGHSAPVYTASISPDGRRILTASHDGTVRLWDTNSGQPLTELLGHYELVRTASFSPDGRRVLTASHDSTARLWDATSGQLLTELFGHTLWVTAASFSPNSRCVLTASADGTARLWDADSGQPLVELHGHSGPVITASISPDGHRALTASHDGTARLWSVYELCAPVKELVELAQTMARELSEEERRFYLHEDV